MWLFEFRGREVSIKMGKVFRPHLPELRCECFNSSTLIIAIADATNYNSIWSRIERVNCGDALPLETAQNRLF